MFLKIGPDRSVWLPTSHGSNLVRSIRLETGWIGIWPAEGPIGESNEPINSFQTVRFDSIFFSIKMMSFWCFWHQNDAILEDIKPHSPNPPSPNRSCRPPPYPPLMRHDRLPLSTISLCKISLHRPLQDHHRPSRVFPVVSLQATKPPLAARTPTVNPLRPVVT